MYPHSSEQAVVLERTKLAAASSPTIGTDKDTDQKMKSHAADQTMHVESLIPTEGLSHNKPKDPSTNITKEGSSLRVQYIHTLCRNPVCFWLFSDYVCTKMDLDAIEATKIKNTYCTRTRRGSEDRRCYRKKVSHWVPHIECLFQPAEHLYDEVGLYGIGTVNKCFITYRIQTKKEVLAWFFFFRSQMHIYAY